MTDIFEPDVIERTEISLRDARSSNSASIRVVTPMNPVLTTVMLTVICFLIRDRTIRTSLLESIIGYDNCRW